jgi:rubrerythrin
MNGYLNGGYQGRRSGAGKKGCGCGCNGGATATMAYPTSYSPMHQTAFLQPYESMSQIPHSYGYQPIHQYANQMPMMYQAPTMPTPTTNKPNPSPSPELLRLLEQAVAGETEDRIFYKELIDLAPTTADKEIIAEIRDDELSHFKQFRLIYHDLTGKEISQPVEPTTEEQPQSYMANLRKALFGEIAAVKKYRLIRSLLSTKAHRDILFDIITDELTHMGKYNYLITINKRI